MGKLLCISAMYIDKLDGKIGGDFYEKFAGDWREKQCRLQREIDRHEAAEQSYMDEGVQILELAQNAQRLFEQQEPRQKRRLLNFVLSNCSWDDGEVVATFRQPFDLLAETTAIIARQNAGNTANSAKRESWLPFLNAYRTMCMAPDEAFLAVLVGASQMHDGSDYPLLIGDR
jgi:site-specific DNA recombinase